MVKGFRPDTLTEALEILSKEPCQIIAGGTDLMVQRARGSGVNPGFDRPLMFIGHLEELKKVQKKDNFIHIGAAAILSDLLENALIPKILKDIIEKMAAPPTRNMASVGGNICNASPAGDTLPYFYAVDAVIVLNSHAGEREMSIQDFILAPKKTAIRSDEILIKIIIPDKIFDLNIYEKIGQRKGMSLTKVSFLGMADITHERIGDLRISWGSVAPLVVRARDTENELVGKSTKEIKEMGESIIKRYEPLIAPIDDARSSALYRKITSLNLLRKFIEIL